MKYIVFALNLQHKLVSFNEQLSICLFQVNDVNEKHPANAETKHGHISSEVHKRVRQQLLYEVFA